MTKARQTAKHKLKEAEAVEAVLLAVYRPIVTTLVTVLGVYYLVLAGLHLVVLAGLVAMIMSSLAFLTGSIFLALRFKMLAQTNSMMTVERGASIAAIGAITNVTAHAILAHDPGQFSYLLMLAFAFAMTGPSMRAVVPTLGLITISAILITLDNLDTNLINNTFTCLTAVGGGFIAGRFLHNQVRKQALLQVQAYALVSDLEKVNKKAEQLAREAEDANAAKSAFLANMSHELRTPLNGVVGVAHALATTDLTPHQRDMVSLIESSGNTLTRLLSDILDFSKIEAGKLLIERAPFDLRAEIDAAALVMQAKAQDKGLEFKLTYDEDARGVFEGDATRIKQVVANLVSNAVKFTEKGSVRVHVSWKPAQEWLVLEVADTGIGFDKEAGRKLFERFIQADTSITRRYGGTGLGLSICRGLIDAMGGGLKWASEPGAGTCFTVTLPLEPSDVNLDKGKPEPIALDQNEARLRILAAEDHPTNQQVLRLILEPLGVDLHIVADGQLALDAFKAQSFDVILMDMQMPVMDGLTSTQAIRGFEIQSGRPRTPVIMLTANALREHKEASTAAGADLHVAKPFTPQSLIGAIEALLSEDNVQDLAEPATVSSEQAVN